MVHVSESEGWHDDFEDHVLQVGRGVVRVVENDVCNGAGVGVHGQVGVNVDRQCDNYPLTAGDGHIVHGVHKDHITSILLWGDLY